MPEPEGCSSCANCVSMLRRIKGRNNARSNIPSGNTVSTMLTKKTT